MQHGTTLVRRCLQLMLLPLVGPLRSCLALTMTAYLFESSQVSETCPDVLEPHGGCATIAVSELGLL